MTPVPVRLIHGEIGSGKTRRASAWVEAEGLGGRSLGGVLALKTPEGRRFMDLATGEEVPLEHPTGDEIVVPVGRFLFRQAAFDWAIERIEQAVATGASGVVIDEVGPLEMGGGGFADLLDRLASDHPAVERILLVRTSLVHAVSERFGGESCIFDPPCNLPPPAT